MEVLVVKLTSFVVNHQYHSLYLRLFVSFTVLFLIKELDCEDEEEEDTEENRDKEENNEEENTGDQQRCNPENRKVL